MSLILINWAGPVVRLKVGQRNHTFEMHRYCGPIRLMSDGVTESKVKWSAKSSFWPVFDSWMTNGQKVDKFGRGMVEHDS